MSTTTIPTRTLAAPFERSGRGVHRGLLARVRVEPAPFGTGLVFTNLDGTEAIGAQIGHAVSGSGATVLAQGEMRVETTEHLLAALYGCGVTDARVVIDGEEVPIMDGSARPWVEAVRQVGVVDGPPARCLAVQRAVRVERGEAYAAIEPFDGCRVEVVVDYGDDMGPRGRAGVELAGDAFAREVAWARTFVMAKDIPRLRAAGKGRGADIENTVIWGPQGVENPDGLRADDESVRHKLLDAVGDLALLGAPWRGRVEVYRGGHALHHDLIRALLGDPTAWTWLGPSGDSR